MTATSDYLEAAIMDHIFRSTALAQINSIYVALFTGNPGDAYTGSGSPEIGTTGTGYARVAVIRSDAGWNRTNNTVSNAAAINFATATASWGDVTHAGFLNNSSAGNLYFYGSLNTSRNVASGDVVRFLVGALAVAQS